jgi:multidrug efflux system membrane fusion protein
MLGVSFSIAVVCGLIVVGVLSAQRLGHRPRTDDAYLQADLVHMAPDVSGRIVSLAVRDNQFVHAGDVLFTIDQEPYRLAVEQARADMLGLEAKLNVTGDQVASQTSKADAAFSGVFSAQAQLALASASLARVQPLLARGFVTAEQVDQARTAKRTAEVSLQQARQQAQEARQGISSVKPAQQELLAERAALALAERNLRLTVVRAPCDGRISGLDISAGEFAVQGHPLFTIIDTDHWYAIGNFRETELSAMRPGQPATVYVLGAAATPLHGTVDSLGWGVTPDEGAQFQGLPHVPRSLSWVRIAQRFPVRILLDAPSEAMMRVGASVVVVIDLSE